MLASKLRPGNIFRMDGQTYRVEDYEYVQNDRRKFIRIRMKNLNTNVIQEHRFNGEEFLEDAQLTYRELQFSYNVDSIYTFMDMKTFEQIDVDYVLVKDAMKYQTDDTVYTFTFLDEKIINIAPPTFVVLEVIMTEPSVAGDTARNALKNAELQGGLVIKVPMFVNTGDKIKVDTRDGSYSERA